MMRTARTTSQTCFAFWLSLSARHSYGFQFSYVAKQGNLSNMKAASSSSSLTETPSYPSRILETFDPCVVLMKEMVGQYADQWKDRGGIYSLAQGVVWWTPPDSTREALQSALEDPTTMLHMYGPDEGLQELRQELTNKIARENGLTNHDVMVTMGANQAYMNCVLTLIESQTQKAVVFAPYYFNHVMALQMTLASSDEQMLVGPVDPSNGQPDLQWLREQFERHNRPAKDSAPAAPIQMVTLTNPGNPTGCKLSRTFVKELVELCREFQCWLVLDCTYEYFAFDETDKESASSDQNNRNIYFDGCFADPHVIHIFSLSKSYALAGYRCGYVVTSKETSPLLYEQMLKVQDTVPIAPTRIGQIAALGALRAGPTWVQDKFRTLREGRTAILNAMTSMENVMGGNGAMYVMGKLPVSDDQAVARLLVEEFGVAVIPGSFCGFPGWIRVCYANLEPSKCQEAATRLERGLKAILSQSGQAQEQI